MVGICSWSRYLVIAVVFTIDTLTVSRHIHRGHLFCIEVCLQRRTCSEARYNAVHNSCQVQHASEGGSLQPDELIYPTGSVWGLRIEAGSDKTGNAIYQIRCTSAQHALQHMHGIVCSGYSLHDSSNSEEAEDVFVGIQPPKLGPSDAPPSEVSISATRTTATSPSSRKDNRSSDSSKIDTTPVHQTDTLATGGGTEGDTTTMAGVGVSVVNKHDNKQLQSFRKPGSSVDTSSDQQELTTPSVLGSSAVDVPESPHETVTDQTTSRDQTTFVEHFTCKDPPDLENAVLVSKDSAQITYKCKDGFTPTTPILLECLATGTWTNPQKTCVKVCSELPQLYGAEPLPGDNTAGTIRLYKCSEGFTSDQKMETTCLDTGKWTLPSNRYACTVSCVEPPDLENAVLVSKGSAEITYKCKEGFTPTTPILLECLPTGTWTTPTETCNEVGCTTAPRYVMHATPTTGNSTYQSYKCTKRYKETGPIYSICVDGKWTTPTEKCIGKCGPAPEVDNAILGKTTATRQYYTCKPGSNQREQLYAMCVGVKWIKPSKSCDAGCSKAPRYVMHASTTSGNSTYQSYKCAKRYQETGPIYSICVDGKWTKPTEKCTVHCGPAPDVQNAIRERATATRQYYKCKPGYVQTGKLYAMCSGGKKWVTPISGSCDVFGATEQMNAVEDERVNQPSGLAASWRHEGYLYTHNDYHAAPEVYVLEAETSHVVATVHIQNAVNNDWEDIAVGPCGEDTCIYVGDIGGHEHGVDDMEVANIIYRVKEPDSLENTRVDADVLRFNGAYDDAYVLLVDPEETLYVVSNDEDDNYVHLLPNNWGGDTVKDAEVLHFLTGRDSPMHTFWSGDISPDGSILVILQNNFIYYWDVGEGGIKEATKKSASAGPIKIMQPQGATFKVDMSGLYIITEDTDLPMYFVKNALHGQT